MPVAKAVKAVAAVPPCPDASLQPTILGPVASTEADERLYHPVLPVVQAALTPLTTAQRQGVLAFRLSWVRRHRDAARAALGSIGLSQDLPEQLAVRTVADAEWPLTSRKRVKLLHARLHARQRTPHKASYPCEDTDTDRALAALGDATIVPAAAASAADSASLLLQLRCLADVYIRWQVGARVTQTLLPLQLSTPALSAGQMLARVLAFWRIEGDLAVPAEADTLTGSDSPAGTSVVPFPPGRTRQVYNLNPSPYVYCVTVVARRANLDPGVTEFGDWKFDLTTQADMQRFAAAALLIVLCGFDIYIVFNTQRAAEFASGFDPGVDRYNWAALNRRVPAGRSLADARAEAAAADARRVALIDVATVGAPPVWRAATVGAAAYTGAYSGSAAELASITVREGVQYLNRLTRGPERFTAASPTRVPELIVYALYHLGHQFTAMFASAAAQAVHDPTASAEATALANALPADAKKPATPLGAAIRNVRKAKSTDAAVIAAIGAWATLAPALGTTAVLNALTAYIRSEPDTTWTAWTQQRSNVIGYDQLYRYYANAFGVAP